ncbi:glycosyltransferase family 10 [Candidatus Rickettsia barbariae]
MTSVLEYKHSKYNRNKTYFACFLVSNGIEDPENDGCIARNRFFHKLSLYKKVVSGSKYLNTESTIIPKEKTREWLSKCKFVIAFENKTSEGYVTTKPFQAYLAGAVPIIYYADKSYIKDVNPNSVIFVKDYSEEDLYNYIIPVDKDDEKYYKIYRLYRLQKKITSIKYKLKTIFIISIIIICLSLLFIFLKTYQIGSCST